MHYPDEALTNAVRTVRRHAGMAALLEIGHDPDLVMATALALVMHHDQGYGADDEPGDVVVEDVAAAAEHLGLPVGPNDEYLVVLLDRAVRIVTCTPEEGTA